MLEREGNIIYEIVDNTVTARYTEPWEHLLCIEIHTSFQGSCIIFPSIFEFLYKHRYKEYGIAKCSPNDKFDKQFGKKLARERLVTKYNRMRYRYFRNIENILNKAHMLVSNKKRKYFGASIYKKEG